MNTKIFSIGINPNWNFDELYQLLYLNQDYIHSIYFSIPLKPGESKINSYSSKPIICPNQNSIDNLKALGTYAKTLNIKTDFVINTDSFLYKSDNFFKLIDYINYFNPDEITTLPNLAKLLNEQNINIPFIWSFNAKQPLETDFDNNLFNSFVLARHYLWDTKFWPKTKEIRFLVNSGCPECVGCTNYGFPACIDNFQSSLNKGLDYYIAYHLVTALDIKLYLNNFNNNFVFKFDSRISSNLNDFIILLDDFKNNKNNYIKNWDLHYTPLMSKNPIKNMNIAKFIYYKQQLWDSLCLGVKYNE